MQEYESFASLLKNDEYAHSYYLSLAYDVQCAVLCTKDFIHSISNLKLYAKQAQNYKNSSDDLRTNMKDFEN